MERFNRLRKHVILAQHAVVEREVSFVKREASESGTRDVSRSTLHVSRVTFHGSRVTGVEPTAGGLVQHPAHAQGGFSLIEGMLALSVLAIGLLAVVAMEEMALSRNVDANQMSLVTNLGTEMVDRIRFNAPKVTVYSGVDTLNTVTRPPSTEPQARGDYDQWSARLATLRLPGVQGTVTVTPSGPTAIGQSLVTVRITWSGGLRNRALIVSTMVTPV